MNKKQSKLTLQPKMTLQQALALAVTLPPAGMSKGAMRNIVKRSLRKEEKSDLIAERQS